MPVNLPPPTVERIFAVDGVSIGTAAAGIRKPGRRDLTLLLLEPGVNCAAVFTRNRFCAAPVIVAREHLAQAAQSGASIRALLINTGNANAGTGAIGLSAARDSCAALAALLDCRPEQILPFSTGVILEPLPLDRLRAGLPELVRAARAGATATGTQAWIDAAHAIMTTDTAPKVASRRVDANGRAIHVTGIAKGAGMIRPNMATMLGFIATDAAVALPLLQRWVRTAADASFNRITIDGDTSTNDSLVLIGGGGAPRIERDDDPAAAPLQAAINAVALELAQAIVRDGEGATKFITIAVGSAATEQEAARVAYAIAHSPLVKTAFFASDPNLGRILAAIGYAGIDDLDVGKVDVWLDDVHVARAGGRHPDYRETDGQRVMKQSEITIRVALSRGQASATVWTCDLSHDYVSINADYRS